MNCLLLCVLGETYTLNEVRRGRWEGFGGRLVLTAEGSIYRLEFLVAGLAPHGTGPTAAAAAEHLSSELTVMGSVLWPMRRAIPGTRACYGNECLDNRAF